MSVQCTEQTVKVAMIEEATLVGLGMKTIVDADPTMSWIGRADTVAAAIGLCRAQSPDVIVVGAWSDRQWTACQMLTDMFHDLAVIALIGEAAASFTMIREAKLSGVHGLVALDTNVRRIPAAIKATVTNRTYIDPRLETAFTTAPSMSEGPIRPLSKREFEVLQLIAEGRTAGNIGSKLGITADTVRTHVGHILRKLKARDRAHAVARAFEISLLQVNLSYEVASSTPVRSSQN